MHRSGESRAGYSSQRRSNGRDSACIATNSLDLRLARCLSRGATAWASALLVASAYASRQREQGRLCKGTTEQRTSKCMHRDGESSAEYEYNGASAATEHASRRRKQTMHRCGRAMAATAGASRPTAGQTMPCYGGATAKTEHLHRDGSSRADYTRIQRQGQSLHPYDDSRADYATLLRSNGSDISCVATAKAAQTMHGYNGATAQCLHRDGEVTVATQQESSLDYA